MKPLYWKRIQIAASATPLSGNGVVEIIWDKLEDVEVRGDELEEKFGKADLRSKSKPEPTEVKQTEKVAKIIDGKKSQNLGIFLRSKKIDAEIVRQILFECDTSWEVESLVALQGYKAHPEEELPELAGEVGVVGHGVLLQSVYNLLLATSHSLRVFQSTGIYVRGNKNISYHI